MAAVAKFKMTRFRLARGASTERAETKHVTWVNAYTERPMAMGLGLCLLFSSPSHLLIVLSTLGAASTLAIFAD